MSKFKPLVVAGNRSNLVFRFLTGYTKQAWDRLL